MYGLNRLRKNSLPDGGHSILRGFDLSNHYAWRRSEAGVDVQLFDLGTADTGRSSGTSDSRSSGSCSGSDGPEFEKLYSSTGRPSIAPERLLRATLLMILFSIRSERQLMEQMNYNLL